jgi:hypothetical protein
MLQLSGSITSFLNAGLSFSRLVLVRGILGLLALSDENRQGGRGRHQLHLRRTFGLRLSQTGIASLHLPLHSIPIDSFV